MIAQVLTTAVDMPITDEMRKFIAEATAQARKADGCEAVITLADATTGEGLSITLFRDQAAVDAFDSLRQTLTNQADEMGAKVSVPRVYEVLANL
jgi:hypothetical protein